MHYRCYPVADRNVLRAFEEEPAVASRMRRENGFQIKGSTVGESFGSNSSHSLCNEENIDAKEKYRFQRTQLRINGKTHERLMENWNATFFENIRNFFI